MTSLARVAEWRRAAVSSSEQARDAANGDATGGDDAMCPKRRACAPDRDRAPENFKAFMAGEVVKWGPIIKAATSRSHKRRSMRMTTSRTLLVALALLALPADHAAAQASDYPTKPVTFIVPFAPGGVTSLFARILGQRLEQRLGKPFVIDNRPGGGGVTAAAAVANAAADGYTIMMASSTILAINVTVRKNLPYDPRKDLTPIALLARVPFVLVVNPALPVRSVADLVKLAKDKPGGI